MKYERQILSLSGLASGLAPSLYKRLSERLPRELPEYTDHFEFLGSPFAQSGFSFPLNLSEQERCLHVTTRLLQCWVKIDEFNHEYLIPTLETGRIPIVLRYGLDAYLYACQCCEHTNTKVLQKLEAAHDALVQLRILEEDIPPPQYLIPWISSESITDAWIAKTRLLQGTSVTQLHSFNSREEKLIRKYCDPSRGQKTSWWLKGVSTENMCDEAIRVISETVRGRVAA